MAVSRALGTLDSPIYFVMVRSDNPQFPKGYVMLAPQEIGHGPELARMMFEKKYKHMGFEYRDDCDTLQKVRDLQQKIVDQELALQRKQAETDQNMRDRVHRETASSLRQRMASSSTSAYEREFIHLWLEMQDARRDKYTQRWLERQTYLWALEQDAGTKVEDRMA